MGGWDEREDENEMVLKAMESKHRNIRFLFVRYVMWIEVIMAHLMCMGKLPLVAPRLAYLCYPFCVVNT